jgi:cytochrome P450
MSVRPLPPGPRLPSAINAIRFARDPIAYIRSFYERYGSVAKSRFPGLGLMIYVAEPALVKQVFAADPSLLRAGEANSTVLEPAVGTSSLLTLDQDAHMRHRKLLLPPFHGDNVKRWEATIREITERDMETWPVGVPFSLRSHTQRITLDVILRAVFGVRDDERFKRAQGLVDRFARRAHPIVLYGFMRRDLGPWSPWARFKRARAELDEFLYEEIALRRAEADIEERDDVLSLLLRGTDADGKPLSDRELRDELVTVIGAGHETTATGLAWAFDLLFRAPDKMERLRKEIAAADGHDYVDAVVKETLRVRPVVPFVGRQLREAMELGGYQLPAGTDVMPAIYLAHTRPDVYPDPYEFRPERFLEGAPESFAWIPFGGGTRRCIGGAFAEFEMRVVLETILRRADLRPATDRPERVVRRNVTLSPRRGTPAVLVERR